MFSCSQLFLCLLISVSSFGHKKTRGKKGGSKKAQKGCELRYFTVGSTKHKTECSTSYKTECSTSYEDVCSQHTVTEYVKKCRSDIVAQPAESCTVEVLNRCEKGTEISYKDECYTSFTKECHDDQCHQVPHQDCQKVPVEALHHHCHKTNGPKICKQHTVSKNVQTCNKVPVESKHKVCKPEQKRVCQEVPSRSCQQVAVRVPRRAARRVCY